MAAPLLVAVALAAAARPTSSDGAAMVPPRTIMDLQAAAGSTLGWELVNNSNLPEGRGVPGICTGSWGTMIFGGETLETENSDETWLLDEPGGEWQRMEYPIHPSARALPAVAPWNGGCLLFAGVFHNGMTTMFNDTWFWTPNDGWTELHPAHAPTPRFYHTLKDMSNGQLVLFGGRNQLIGAEASSLGETWIWNGTWTELSFPGNMNLPWRRWGHAMTCGLFHTGPPTVTSAQLPNGAIECLLFSGAQQGDDDYLDDTWLFRYQTDFTTNEVIPNSYFWEQLNDDVRPHGRWCFSIATCGSRVLMVGGSTDFRLAADETWVWEPSVRAVESASSSGHQGHWRRLYGTGPFDEIPEPRPPGAGPLRISAHAMANAGGRLGASDILLFGGVNNQSGGLFIHKGWETSEMWRWPCTEETWPEALIASPPAPPSPPQPPSLPPGEYNGGTHGYGPVWRGPTPGARLEGNQRLSINELLHQDMHQHTLAKRARANKAS